MPGSKCRCQVRRFQLSGTRFQVSGAQVPGARDQLSDARLQVSGASFHVPHSRYQGSDLRDQVSCQNVENLDIKNVLRFNKSYKLFSSQRKLKTYKQIFHHTNVFFSTFPKKNEKKHSHLQCPCPWAWSRLNGELR